MALRPPVPLALACLLLSAISSRPAGALPPAPFRTFVGEVPGDRFGSAVNASGDVNGDGHADLVVGAQWNDHDAANAGRAYLFFGGPGGDATADLILAPPDIRSRALTGFSVAIPGDLNGDGKKDIAVGSPVFLLRGRVFLYWGGPALDGTPDRILQGQENGEFFAGSVACEGDDTGDGIDDIWVGAPMFIPFLTGEPRAGRGYFYFGGPTSDGIVDLLFEARPVDGVRDLLQLGTSVAPAGDVNHDGRADILAGQPADGERTAGRGYVYYGSNGTVHRVPDRILLPPEFRFRSGTSVSSAGDFNADGELDQVIGAPDSGFEESLTAGRAYVFFGSASPDLFRVPDLELKGPGGYDAFGSTVAGGVDVSGDGYPDILVGAPWAEGAAGYGAGRVYVYYGGPRADAIPDVVLEGSAANASLGAALALGDMNGDGTADAIVGATPVGSITDPGHVYVYDLVAPLPARVFAHDEHRTIPLHENGAPICLRLAPVDGAFDLADVDLGSVRLRSAAPDIVIAPAASKRTLVGDTDGDGAPEIELCFERADLARLFPGVRGRHEVTASVEGSLLSGKRIAGDVTLTIVRTGPERDLDASVAPNPMNPEAMLAFTLARGGRVTARLFDARGRLKRTVAADREMAAGPQRLRLDGRDDSGQELPSGVYFYRLLTPDGESRGRVVVAK